MFILTSRALSILIVTSFISIYPLKLVLSELKLNFDVISFICLQIEHKIQGPIQILFSISNQLFMIH